jgi:predicted acyltransferase
MPWILLLTIGLIVFNLYGLYMRYLILNLVGTIAILCVLYILLQVEGKNTGYWYKLFRAGTYLILLGLAFEAYEGGIRKDPSTYSYYFLASGLAFMAMIAFSIMCDIYSWSRLTRPLEYAGQNPMIAYVSTQLVVLPLLNLAGLGTYLSYLDQNAWLGFLRGVIITSLALLITILFTKLKCFWRT